VVGNECQAFGQITAYELDMASSYPLPSEQSPVRAIASPLLRRNYAGNRFVYSILSQRADGFALGVNMNPDKRCNFDCIYCEVDRSCPGEISSVDVETMAAELHRMLHIFHNRQHQLLGYPKEVLELFSLKEIALSGDGEPTLCLNFHEVVDAVVQGRLRSRLPFLKIVLLTNASHLHRLEVRDGIALFDRRDEIWAKLDVGTQDYMNTVNGGDASLRIVLKNIRELALKRPVIIQSLFCAIDGGEPSRSEVLAYAQQLRSLRLAGAHIPLVQIYSVRRPVIRPNCTHLPLQSLSKIARLVRSVSGLHTEIF